jgi:hypothetical protein
MLLRRASSRVGRRQLRRCFSSTVQAVFFEYDSLNRLEDYAEDMERSSEAYSDEKRRVGGLEALSSDGQKPWEFKMHDSAQLVFEYLAREDIKAVRINYQ